MSERSDRLMDDRDSDARLLRDYQDAHLRYLRVAVRGDRPALFGRYAKTAEAENARRYWEQAREALLDHWSDDPPRPHAGLARALGVE